MTDLEYILPLWRELESTGAEYVLATVVKTEGSSYRKPGARMLLAADGRRAGMVSGGCLEAAVARKAWWLTEDGPAMRPYSTYDDDGELPFGSGCGGVIWILLERRKTADAVLLALASAWDARKPLAIATVLEGEQIAQRAFGATPEEAQMALGEGTVPVWVEYCAARPGLWVFGAGDDTKPLVKIARTLGWYVTVADGRSHLATTGRFAEADAVRVLPAGGLPRLDLHACDAAVVKTHSFEQDARILGALLVGRVMPAYIGVLGPQRRTRELLEEVAKRLDLVPHARLIEAWLEQLHAPTGLDLIGVGGAQTPATIALSIVAEIQKAFTAATALPLKQVRGLRGAVAQN